MSYKYIVVILLIAASAMARIAMQFTSWEQVERNSSSIIIARCGERMPPTPGVVVINDTKSNSKIDVIAVLKGTNSISPAQLETDHDLQKGENYLIFGYFDGDVCEAFEEYRIMPLGGNFHTNSIEGKSLNEQLQILFQRRSERLKKQIQKEQEEEQRMEQGVFETKRP